MPFPAPGDLPDPGTEARICCTGRRVLHLSRSLLVDGFELSSPIPSTGVLFKPVRLQAPFSSRVDPPPICREGKLKPLPAWLALRLCLRPHPCFNRNLVQFPPPSSSYRGLLASLLVPRLSRLSLPRGLLFFYSALPLTRPVSSGFASSLSLNLCSHIPPK